MTEQTAEDSALRTLGVDGNFRILVASTGRTVSGVLDAQKPREDSAGVLADLVSASVLLRLTMSPDYRLQAILQAPQAGRMVADSRPDGITRGLIQRTGEAPFSTGGATRLSIHRTIFGGKTHQGVVETTAEQTIGDAFSGYLHRSEQITSVVKLGHRFDDNANPTFAGGYLVQLMPAEGDPDQASLALMTARLENLPSVPRLFDDCGGDVEKVAEMLYGPLEFEALETNRFRAGCVCSPQRVLDALGTLSEADRRELRSEEDLLHIDCDYCATTHEIDPAEL